MDIDTLDSAHCAGTPLVEDKVYDKIVMSKGSKVRKKSDFNKVVRSGDIFIQPKFNGVQCIFRVENNQIVYMCTRGGKDITKLAEHVTIHTTTPLKNYDGAGELIIEDDDAVCIVTKYVNLKKPTNVVPLSLFVYEIHNMIFLCNNFTEKYKDETMEELVSGHTHFKGYPCDGVILIDQNFQRHAFKPSPIIFYSVVKSIVYSKTPVRGDYPVIHIDPVMTGYNRIVQKLAGYSRDFITDMKIKVGNRVKFKTQYDGSFPVCVCGMDD